MESPILTDKELENVWQNTRGSRIVTIRKISETQRDTSDRFKDDEWQGKIAKVKKALEDMVYQFGYRGITKKHRPMIWCGGLSALEWAFDALGWDNPHEIPEEGNTCEIEGCMNKIAAGQHWGNGKEYLQLCSKHTQMEREGKPCPPIKKYALDREAKRDPETGCLPVRQP